MCNRGNGQRERHPTIVPRHWCQPRKVDRTPTRLEHASTPMGIRSARPIPIASPPYPLRSRDHPPAPPRPRSPRKHVRRPVAWRSRGVRGGTACGSLLCCRCPVVRWRARPRLHQHVALNASELVDKRATLPDCWRGWIISRVPQLRGAVLGIHSGTLAYPRAQVMESSAKDEHSVGLRVCQDLASRAYPNEWRCPCPPSQAALSGGSSERRSAACTACAREPSAHSGIARKLRRGR